MAERSVGLDVLRAGCVSAVLVTHFAQFAVPAEGAGAAVRNALAVGSFGVTGFFLLSAYLLTGILLREVAAGRPKIWRRYWIRRSLRIWPLYFAVIGVWALAGVVTGSEIASLPWLATFTFNWVSWAEPNALLSHFWSMCAEEQLYVLVPLLSFVAFRRRWPLLIALIAVAPLARVVVSGLLPYPGVWNVTTSHLDVFALGVLLASVDHSGTPQTMRAREWIASSRLVGAGTWVLAGVLIAASAFDPGWVFGSSASSWTYLAAALVWASILLRITRRPWAGSGVVTRAAVWLGRRSYGVYVFHWPAVVVAAWVAGRLPAALTPLIGAGALALVLIGSGLSFRFFESPFLRLKGRFSSDPARAS